jgi:hypothetical protein
MCGIFGWIGREPESGLTVATVRKLFLASETRGKEASGAFAVSTTELRWIKAPVAAHALLRHPAFVRFSNWVESERDVYALVGHTRLVTNGFEGDPANNQPATRDGVVGVHNGIIVNDAVLWAESPNLVRRSALDTEILLALLEAELSAGRSLGEAVLRIFPRLEGTYSVALAFRQLDGILLGTNNGSLYWSKIADSTIFASEGPILESVIETLPAHLKRTIPRQLPPGSFRFVRPNGTALTFSLQESSPLLPFRAESPEKQLRDCSVPLPAPVRWGARRTASISRFERLYERCLERADRMRRCTRCLLPESFPFLAFDDAGVCSVCRDYRPIHLQPMGSLLARIRNAPKRDFDVLVPLSGGRDSCFTLHYVTRELGLRPLAYTYDWGMVTDLARRNQARLCGALGVEHVLVSADIRRKRENIRKNVEAWLRRPHLGMIPLFMAGDKQYFYFTNLLLDQYRMATAIMGESFFEVTGFKTGFCGVNQGAPGKAYAFGNGGKLKLAAFYAGQYVRNPAYFNRSLLDSLGAFLSYYATKRPYVNFYDYYYWNEDEVNSVLISQYDWELAKDTSTTWRIGDGTAPFYNYIYQTVAGFTELDTFRSNQIREGVLSREAAWELVRRERLPRWESIGWYCEVVGLDMAATLERIHQIPTRYGFEPPLVGQQESVVVG